MTVTEYKFWVAGTVNLACNIARKEFDVAKQRAEGLTLDGRVVIGLAAWCCLDCAKEAGLSQQDGARIIIDAVNEWEGTTGYLSKDFCNAILQITQHKD